MLALASSGGRDEPRAFVRARSELEPRISIAIAISGGVGRQFDSRAENGDARVMGYPGGKNGAGVYQKIINLMPPHEVYMEPFLGGGAVMRLKRPAGLNIGLDLAASQVSAMVDQLEAVATIAGNGGAAASAKPARLASGSGIATSGEARRRASLLSSRGAASSGDGGSGIARNVVAAGSIAVDDDGGLRGTASLVSVVEYSIQCGDGISFLKGYRFRGNELVYCDPPYLTSTRKGRKLYEHEMSDREHRRFLRVAIALPCAVLISGYWSQMYADALSGWSHITFESMTRGGRTATEWLWFNFPPPAVLHDYRYLGTNFRERERIKRRKTRWTERLRRMPVLERHALLSAIADFQGAQ